MRPPAKLGPPKSLFGTLHGKSASIQSFASTKTGEIYDYVVFSGPPLTTIVFALTEEREVLVVKQFRHGAEDFTLELPGGVPGDGEMAEENARSELAQEMGYAAESLIALTPEPLYFDPASWRTAFQVFLAQGCKPAGGQNQDITEDIEVLKLPIPEWLRLVEDGEVRDAKSIAATFLAMRVLGSR